jgi:hypothetical protein
MSKIRALPRGSSKEVTRHPTGGRYRRPVAHTPHAPVGRYIGCRLLTISSNVTVLWARRCRSR